ncbi:MAG: dynamin family protein [Chromatiales bacterium]|nr:dynamin family protein [Chromatiales bacterium]
MFGPDPVIVNRLQSLESHLRQENPILLNAVQSYREVDKVAYRMGLLPRSNSYAMMIPWWPLISILGTFSAGKSTFINHYLGLQLQSSGNQAVDDKFTVICHSREDAIHVLPGLALDADPRFPFYQISEDIETVAGEGNRVDSYLQLKTCHSEPLKGKIIIDSPGFDADDQRTATLRITEHIVNLSDLVIVFFDARHPEPGAMQDTLEHLVARSIHRADASKFLYVLNQIDTTAREDNPEEVFGAWQRALAQKGLTAGRFYTIYNPDVAVPIADENTRRRFESKRDADMDEIHGRIQAVEVERAYRIVGALEKTARNIENRIVPLISEALVRWRRRTLILDGIAFGTLTLLALMLSIQLGYWEGVSFVAPWATADNVNWLLGGVTLILGAGLYLHHRLRALAALSVAKWLRKKGHSREESQQLQGGFTRSTLFWRSLFNNTPAGWGRRSRRQLANVVADTDRFVQRLNDTFADPSGGKSDEPRAAVIKSLPLSERNELSAEHENGSEKEESRLN